MTQLNSIVLEGNVTRKPEVKEIAPDAAVCTIPIAVNRSYKNKDGQYTDEVSYFDIKSYGKYAAQYADRLDIGRGVRLIGRLKQERWTNADGQRKNKIIVIAEHIYLLPRKDKDTAAGEPGMEIVVPADGTAATAGSTAELTARQLNDLAEAATARQVETPADTPADTPVF